MILLLILGFLLTVAFALCVAYFEATAWSRLGADAFSWNEHLLIVGYIACFFLQAILGHYSQGIPLWLFLIYLKGNALLFSALKPSFYYQARHVINPENYPKGWKSDPSDAPGKKTSKINFSFKTRKKLAIAGLSVFAISLILTIVL